MTLASFDRPSSARALAGAMMDAMGVDDGPAAGAWASRSAAELIARLRDRPAAGPEPLVVGIDGRSGAGKSTLAAAVASGFADEGDGSGLVVIEGDQFYAGGSAEVWDRRSAAENADRVIDWQRQREVLEQLRRRGWAEWDRFDWDAEGWDSDDAPFAAEPVVARGATVIVLEGAYSCRPELHGLLDLRVLLDVPPEVRRRQLLEREGDGSWTEWEVRWSAAEDHYFGTVMPPKRFDLVLGAS